MKRRRRKWSCTVPVASFPYRLPGRSSDACLGRAPGSEGSEHTREKLLLLLQLVRERREETRQRRKGGRGGRGGRGFGSRKMC